MRINIVRVVINEHGPIFAELVELLAEAMRHWGVEVTVSTNDVRSDRGNLLVGATCFLRPPALAKILTYPAPLLVFQAEALDCFDGFIERMPPYLRFLSGVRQIWDYSQKNLAFLESQGIGQACYVPIGYSRALERIAPNPESDVDVLFYGNRSPRRQWICEELQNRGIETLYAYGAYGATRDAMIARARIVLNVHQFAVSPLEQLRISYLLNNRRFVVSETSDCNPYGDGVVFCEYDEIPRRCQEYLAAGMETERARIANNGYECLQVIPMRESVRLALERLETDPPRAPERPPAPMPSPTPTPFFRF